MRSKNRTVGVSKAINLGRMPVFISMIHRHFEKEQPPPIAGGKGQQEFKAPIDLVRLTLTDKTLVDDIDSVTLTYSKRA